MKMIKCSRDASSTDLEPLSPTARMFHDPKFDFYIVATIGWKTSINAKVFKAGLEETFICHPRFSSKMVMDHDGGMRWFPTTVNVDDHVIIPNLDHKIASPEQFIEDYVYNLTKEPLDKSMPLWQIHILNVKTSEAESVTVFKIHHSMGDGTSLISLLLACCKKTSDPEALPTISKSKRAVASNSGGLWCIFLAIWSALRMIYNSFVDIILFLASSIFLKDTETPIKGGPGVELTPKRIVHRTVSLDDIKHVKAAMGTTVNDVVFGVTQAALSKYLNRRYGDDGKDKNQMKKLPRNIRIRAITYFNLRPNVGLQSLSDMVAEKSKEKWGNKIGYVLLPLKISLEDDPIEYIRKGTAVMDKKKCSLEANFSFGCAKLLLKLFGHKVTTALTHKINFTTTMSYSNVPGPLEEVSFCGHPIAYIAPSIYGHPQALTIHFQSYVSKMTIILAVDPNVIPDPHQLCEDFAQSLKTIKDVVLKRNLNQFDA